MTIKDPRFDPKLIRKKTDESKKEDRTDDKIVGKEIANNSILSDHLADNIITTQKIVNGAVTTAKIADSNITEAKIANDAVSYSKLSSRAMRVYTSGGWTGSTGDRNVPFADGMYNMWGYNAANSPSTYTAGIGFGLGGSGSVEIAGSWTPGGLWTRHLRDCCQNWSGWASITIGAYSDKRRKADITPITDAVQTLQKLEPVSYLERHPDGSVGKVDHTDPDLKKMNIREFGLIAQDTIIILPEVVTHIKCNEPSDLNADWASAYEIDYARIVPILIAAIKEQQIEIDKLKNKLKES